MSSPERRSPSATSKPLFRREAIEAYLVGPEGPATPLALPKTQIAALWIGVVALVAAGLLVATYPVPSHVTGLGVASPEETALDALFPVEGISKLRPGRRVTVRTSAGAPALTGTIESVDPGLITPSEAARRHGTSAGALRGDVVVARVALTSPVQTRDLALPAVVRVEAKDTLAMMLPFAGRLGGIGRE